MTNEYKENLLRYLTNKAKTETGENEIQYIENEEIDNNLYNYLYEELGVETITRKTWFQSEFSNTIIFYGNYNDEENGFIALLDENLTPYKVFKEFNSGTPFRTIMAINEDENGNFYAIDSITNGGTQTCRFLMLNNFIQDNEVDLRTSYTIPSEYNMEFYENGLKKVISEAVYYLIGSNSNDKIGMIEFTINVGSQNEWKYTTANHSGQSIDFVLAKENDKNTAIILSITKIVSTNSLYKGKFTDGTYTENQIASGGNLGDPIIINDNLMFYDTLKYGGDSWEELKIYKYENSTPTIIYEDRIEDTTIENLNIGLLKFENTIVILKTHSIYPHEDIERQEFYYSGIYYNDELKPTLLGTRPTTTFGTNLIVGFKRYNLYKIGVQFINLAFVSKAIINGEYEGQSFNDKNSLFPYSTKLLDENNKVIFARNLYNKSLNQNITTSSVEIPNNYLNNNVINKEDLLSINNNILIDNTQPITKNIYEKLYINFINTILMSNENDPDNITYNNVGATRLNNSTNEILDYENATITKIRINYLDGTNKIQMIDCGLIENGMQLKFILQVDKEIISIEFISDDELTTYQTIKPELEVGKSYNINQNVSVKGLTIKITYLTYNNDDILYNNDEIYIIEE